MKLHNYWSRVEAHTFSRKRQYWNIAQWVSAMSVWRWSAAMETFTFYKVSPQWLCVIKIFVIYRLTTRSLNREYYMTFSILALVSSQDSHISPRRSRGLIWVEGWYQGQYGKGHVLFFLSYTSNISIWATTKQN